MRSRSNVDLNVVVNDQKIGEEIGIPSFRLQFSIMSRRNSFKKCFIGKQSKMFTYFE